MALGQPPVSGGTQNFKNHAQAVPGHHMFASPVLPLNVMYQGSRAVMHPGIGNGINLLVALALFAVPFYERIFALRVQDRGIRLEMRLRMAEILPPDLRARVGDFSVRQLVALRFASDEELPDLARKVLDGNITDAKAIKQMVKAWQADTLRG